MPSVKRNLSHKFQVVNKVFSPRREKFKKPYKRTLIMCEGEKTEPQYLRDLLNDLKLNPRRIVIRSCRRGSDPISIVDEAIDTAKNNKYEYDYIYCVFDHDERDNEYKLAIQKLKNADVDGTEFYAITSVPCFEIWFLLHYTYSDKQYMQAQSGSRTVSEQVMLDVEKEWSNYMKNVEKPCKMTKELLPNAIHNVKKSKQKKIDNPWSDYKKNMKGLYKITKEHLPNAIHNAKKLEQKQNAIRNAKKLIQQEIDNPSTKMHILVEYLQKEANTNFN